MLIIIFVPKAMLLNSINIFDDMLLIEETRDIRQSPYSSGFEQTCLCFVQIISQAFSQSNRKLTVCDDKHTEINITH